MLRPQVALRKVPTKQLYHFFGNLRAILNLAHVLRHHGIRPPIVARLVAGRP